MSVVDDLLAAAQGRCVRDRLALELVAAQVRRAQEAGRLLDAQGVVTLKGEDGDPVPHPAVAIERAASCEVRGWVERRPDLFGPAAGAGGSGPMTLEDELAKARRARTSRA